MIECGQRIVSANEHGTIFGGTVLRIAKDFWGRGQDGYLVSFDTQNGEPCPWMKSDHMVLHIEHFSWPWTDLFDLFRTMQK